MADDNQAASPTLQLLQQPGPMWAIQVIARLVENQHVGCGQKGADQRHAHRFATAELRGRRLRILAVETAPGQGLLQHFANLPALAQQVEIRCGGAARFDPLQCFKTRPDTRQIRNGQVRLQRDLPSQMVCGSDAQAATGLLGVNCPARMRASMLFADAIVARTARYGGDRTVR